MAQDHSVFSNIQDNRTSSLAEQVADQINQVIIDQNINAGEKLPNEFELAARLNVGRGTIREAVKLLVARNCLEIRRGKGTFVAQTLPTQAMDLTALSSLRSRVRAKDLFEMRLIFEPATVAMACQRATDEELRQIQKKADRMERIAAAGGDWPLADQEFHMALIRASHNEYMRRLYPIINSAVNEILQITENRQQMQDIAVRDNQLILEFLLRRDEVGARHAMSIHIKHLINTLHEA